MKLLVVAATPMEVAPIVSTFTRVGGAGDRVVQYKAHGHEVDVLTSGVGMVAASAWTARALALRAYDAAINLGVCGSFDPALVNGRVVQVVTDRIGELGAEDGDAFLTVGELGLVGDDEFPFESGRLVNRSAPTSGPLERLDQIHGLTVSTVHGNERSIANVMERFDVQVESMEGAAFFYCCLTARVPCAQVRAVSNRVERRNRSAWNLPLAIQALNDAASEILRNL
jgi:futalosine hydrolase